jgi:type IV secretory pathway ATPase VirB11/archaellum biosynthesis ATPase
MIAQSVGRRQGEPPVSVLSTGVRPHEEVTSMEKTRYEVVPQDDGWAVKTGGKSTPPFPSKELAISAATARAKQDSPAEVVVHAQDGTVEEEKTV